MARRCSGRRERLEQRQQEEANDGHEDRGQAGREDRDECACEESSGQEAGREEEGDSRREVSVWAVLAAAGSGERLGADRPKAFVRLGARVLLAESLERLDAARRGGGILVAGPPGWGEAGDLRAPALRRGQVSASVA